MRPQNQEARDRLEAALRKTAPASASGLAERLGVSVPTLLRILRERGDRVVRTGSASRTRYAWRRPLRGVARPIPLFRVDRAGHGHEAGVLELIETEGTLLDLAGMGWPVDDEHRDGWWAGLPYPLHQMRPQGFLGRSLARLHAADLDLPTDPEQWHDDQIVQALCRWGADCSGNLILGEAAYTLWQAARARAAAPLPESGLAARYGELAEQASSLGLAGSSAAGEFPKFTASREMTPAGAATTEVIVKFSGADDSATVRRWADLLVCEHLALRSLSGIVPVAGSRILQAGGRTFLEVERFDRHGPYGRSELVSLANLNAALLGHAGSDWRQAAARLAHQLHLAAPDMEAAIRLIWWYGCLIGNSDMHPGNLSFTFTPTPGTLPRLHAAPVYDMLPMLYAPLAGGEVPPREFNPPLPLPAERADWHTAAVAAQAFWHSAGSDTRISEAFRTLARANHDRLAALQQRL